MADEELKENAPWLVILLTLGVAIVAMLVTLWFKKGAEPEEVQGTIFVRQEPSTAPAEPEPAAPELPPASPAAVAASGLLVVPHALPSAPPEEPARDPARREKPKRPREAGKRQAELAEKDKGMLDSLGGLSKPEKQQGFGLSQRLWTAIMPKLAAHPRLIGYLLNNKYVVAGYMARAKSKEVTSSPAAMAAYLTDPTRKDGIAPHAKLFHDMVRANPAIAGVVAGSELATQIINSPGMKGFLNSPGAAMGIAKNPEVLAVLTDPVVLNGLASNPTSATLLGSLPGSRR